MMEFQQRGTISEVGGVTALPACAMLLGSVAVSFSGDPSELLQARMQQFSGGLLIGAVITDIFPILKAQLEPRPSDIDHQEAKWHRIAAATAGFVLAVFLMHLIKSLGLEDAASEECSNSGGTPKISTPKRASSSSGVSTSPFKLPAVASTVWESAAGLLSSPKKRQATPARGSLNEPFMSAAHGEAIDRRGLALAVTRLVERASLLSGLAGDDEVDREAVDEEVHGLDFLLDVALRRCQSDAMQPIDQANVGMLRLHVADLCGFVRTAKNLDPTDMSAIDLQLQMIAVALRKIHRHTEQRVVFRRWGPRPPQVLDALGSPRCASPPLEPEPSAFPLSLNVAEAETAGRAIGDIPVPGPVNSLAAPEEVAAGLPLAVSVPWGLVLAVLVDSVVDGMLIGLAGSVALESGWLMAMATAIEMGFLGYSFACSAARPAEHVGGFAFKCALLGAPPLAMVVSSVLAALGASYIEHSTAFAGLIAFALAAVLFLVVEELLLEAHEREGSEHWNVSVWLYVGLLFSLCLDVMA